MDKISLVMRTPQSGRLVVVWTVVALAALCVSGGNARAYGAERPALAGRTSYSVRGNLSDVVAVSRTEAWAVGWAGNGNPKTLLLGWNGRKWSPVRSPAPVRGRLLGLEKVSPGNIWAVGYAGSSRVRLLVMHWNGRSWRRVRGVPAISGQFDAIGQAGGALLAVGSLTKPPMLNMERIRGRWRRLPVPSTSGELVSLAVTGARRAWAIGVTVNTHTYGLDGDVLLRWNGRSWRNARFPLHGANKNLWCMAAGPRGAVWAVGDAHNDAQTRFRPISMLWTGRTWRKVAVRAPANSALSAVGFVPGGTAWAAGSFADGKHVLILRWTGRAWRRVIAPDPFGASDYVSGIAATSRTDAWAVGGGVSTGSFKTFILHWNGRAWS